jgi:enolase-phosphatase E1
VIEIACKSVLLDIEGTVSPVAFVFDVMFPFARQQAGSFLQMTWQDPATQQAVNGLAIDLGFPDSATWFLNEQVRHVPDQQRLVVEAVNGLMDRDAKVTGLKTLQGLIWREGFERGQLVSELFPDVLPQLRNWHAKGLKLYVYSSGSIAAQKLFFGHTGEGDLLPLFSGFFDTTSGNKKEAASYQAIAAAIHGQPREICFISDVIAELVAAQQAGLQTVWRPASGETSNDHPVAEAFDAISITRL